MVYIRVKKRVTAEEGEPLTLSQVADVLADASLGISAMPISLPRGVGIWQMDALQLIVQLQAKVPGEVINVLGDGMGWLHRETPKARGRMRGKRLSYIVRVAAACVLLAVGSAFAIGWFHADVNMAEAQTALYTTVAGSAPKHPLLVALPYAMGVLLGVLLYYALIGKKTVSPLTVKLREYRETIEKNAKQGEGGT